MKKTLSLTLSFAVAFLGCISVAATPARGQEVASAGNSISKIKEEYERLLAVERNPETPPEVREMNHTFLEQRRAQLREAIQKRLRALRSYQTSMTGTLSDSEGLVVANSIQALERDLSALNGEQKPALPAPQKAPSSRARIARPAPAEASVVPASVAGGPTPAAPAAPFVAFPGTLDFVTAPKTAATATKAAVFNTADLNLKLTFTTPVNEIEVSVENNGKAVTQPKSKYTVKATETGAGASKEDVFVKLAEGDNKITVKVTDPADKSYDPVTKDATYVNPFAAADAAAAEPTPKPKPGAPEIDFIEGGARMVRVLAAEAGADVKLFRNSNEVGTRKANSDKIALFNLEDQADIGNVFEAEQTVDDETSSRSRFVVTEGPFDETRGGPVGIMLGGMVMSQQAQQFQQADPFMGFIAGYTSKMRNAFQMTGKGRHVCGNDNRRFIVTESRGVYSTKDGYEVKCDPATGKWVETGERTTARLVRGGGFGARRWNLRFQGIFESAPRTAEATETTTTNGNGGAPDDPFKFIASRKSFDIETHFWADFWANNTFSLGPYIAVGGTTVLDKNELEGEPVAKPDDEDDDEDGETVASSSKSDNDIKKYYEGGMLMSVALPNRSLFIQSIIAYGKYEALKGLYDAREGCRLCDSQHRFVGKLRIFPGGLIKGFGRQRLPAPVFGVDLNAGRGDDHIRFFTGLAINLKGFGFN